MFKKKLSIGPGPDLLKGKGSKSNRSLGDASPPSQRSISSAGMPPSPEVQNSNSKWLASCQTSQSDATSSLPTDASLSSLPQLPSAGSAGADPAPLLTDRSYYENGDLESALTRIREVASRAAVIADAASADPTDAHARVIARAYKRHATYKQQKADADVVGAVLGSIGTWWGSVFGDDKAASVGLTAQPTSPVGAGMLAQRNASPENRLPTTRPLPEPELPSVGKSASAEPSRAAATDEVLQGRSPTIAATNTGTTMV